MLELFFIIFTGFLCCSEGRTHFVQNKIKAAERQNILITSKFPIEYERNS